ncbi:MAG TPA: SAM-dependent methyltransferase [Sedimenticola sp.]|nr:SAM-dependent methyltransferase [Sedimenticola sp.]
MKGLHRELIFKRRVRVLADWLARLPDKHSTILDVGCGDGLVDHLILQRRPDLTINGIDVMIRPYTWVPVLEYNGKILPLDDNSRDYVMLVDVLHHLDSPEQLLREACRVARKGVILKDHARAGLLAAPTLRFMDWVGNASHGVISTYNYWTQERWQQAFGELGLKPTYWLTRLKLYPFPFSLLFDRSLHFIARLEFSA